MPCWPRRGRRSARSACASRRSPAPPALRASAAIPASLAPGAAGCQTEITPLRQVVEPASGRRPVPFLFDEILHGTSSHARRIGAEAVLRALVARGAVGLATTHDL